MGTCFNLVDEGWIPCVFQDGSCGELSLSDALGRAREIRRICDPSPLVTISLHRLLLAICHSNFGPDTTAQWRRMWEAGGFDRNALAKYFERWHSRFELFDAEFPFYQDAAIDEGIRGPVAKLFHEAASGNNATLFDHRFDDVPEAVPPGVAARKLVAHQNFALGGISSSECGNGRCFANSAPIASGAVHLIAGDDLFATLMLNLVRYSPKDDSPMTVSPDGDECAWERKTVKLWGERYPRGYLDYLTWQSRRIRLFVCEQTGMVDGAAVTKGDEIPRDCYLRDPQMAHVRNPRAKEGTPWSALRFHRDRVLWRDSVSLSVSVEGTSARPGVCDWLAEVERREAVCLGRRSVHSFGLCSSQAKVFGWWHEHLPLPVEHLEDERIVSVLERCLQKAESIGSVLGSALWILAKHSVLADKGEKDITNNDREAIAERLGIYVAESVFWSSLELPFKEMLRGLPDSVAAGKAEEHLDMWVDLACDRAADALERTIGGLRGSARNLRAGAESRPVLRRGLK